MKTVTPLCQPPSPPLPVLPSFLNKLLGMRLEDQELLFSYFATSMDKARVCCCLLWGRKSHACRRSENAPDTTASGYQRLRVPSTPRLAGHLRV